MKDLKRLLDLMFLSTDTVCPSNNKFAQHSVPISSILSGTVTLVCSNSKVSHQTIKTEQLTLLSINPINGFRNDDNVYRCQTFLWECDVGTPKSQMQYMKALGLPYSAAIFSGNKSIHFATVLDEPLDPKTYRLLYQWALKIGTLFDSNCKNPSRSIRIPGVIRPDTGKEQKLLEIKDKVKVEDFMNWLNKYPNLRPKERENKKVLTNGYDYSKLSRWAAKQFKDGIDFSKGRNKTWFGLACDLCKSGYEESEAQDILNHYFIEETDFKEKEFLKSIDSAYKYMANKG